MIIRSWRYGDPRDMKILEIWRSWRYGDPEDLGDMEIKGLYQCGHPETFAKVVQSQQGFSQGRALGYKPRVQDVRRGEYTPAYWDAQLAFWNKPMNQARAAQNRQNRAKSKIEEIRRLEAMGTYTDDEINRLARGGKQRGHVAGVGRVLPTRATASPSTPAHDSTFNSLHKKVDFMMSIFKSDSKYLDMFSHFKSGGASGSGGCGDEEEGADHQDDEDEDGDGDT
nr:F-box domain, leucine-rich repeat domain, L domain-like protein [Tanacetum cinerariifolium]